MKTRIGRNLALLAIAAAAPAALHAQATGLSVVPTTGTGTSQLFTFHAADANGYGYISTMLMLFNTAVSGPNACYIQFAPASGQVYLTDNGATTWGNGGALGSSTVLSNSQCSIKLAESNNIGTSGNDLYLNLAITFTPNLNFPAGQKYVYEYVIDNANQATGWQQPGLWTVGTSLLIPDSVTPSAGSGPAQTFTFTGSSPNGFGYINQYLMLFNTGVSGASACYLQYSGNLLYMANDLGNAWTGGYAPGSSNTLSNSRCMVNTVSVSVYGFSNTLVIDIPITFTTSFTGQQNIYAYLDDYGGNVSGWETMGTWTPYSASAQSYTITSSPVTGTQPLIEGVACTSPCTVSWIPGSTHTISAPSPAAPPGTPSGTRYTFSSWSDGLAQTHSVTAPSSSSTYMANFSTQYYLTTSTSSLGSGGSVTPPSGWYNSGSVVSVGASPNSGYYFAGFTGALSSTTTPQSLTMTGSLSVIAYFGELVHTSSNLYPDFQTCIGPYSLTPTTLPSLAGTCQLSPNRYPVSSTLQILRSNFVIEGGGGPGDTTLYRNGTFNYTMTDNPGVTGVTVTNLTFDGNRYGVPGLNCTINNAAYFELGLRNGGTFKVEWLDFINAPSWALWLNGYGSSLSVSNFGQGGYGVGPDGVLRTLAADESGSRGSSVILDGNNNGAWYNAIAFAGNAAIGLSGPNQTLYGNLLQQNRYEMSDWPGGGGAGGQIYVGANSTGGIVTGNVVNGNYWTTTPTTELATGCPAPQATALNPSGFQYTIGVEAYGFGHYFFNNEIEQHFGAGMQFGGSNPTGQITISSQNPSVVPPNPPDTPRYIEMNAFKGIWFVYSSSNPYAVQGATLYNVNVRANPPFDVDLGGAVNNSTIGYYGPYSGFAGGSCLIPSPPTSSYPGPVEGVNGAVPPPYNNTLSYPTPSSYGTAGSCPNPGWPAQIPATSYIPGWPW